MKEKNADEVGKVEQFTIVTNDKKRVHSITLGAFV